MSDLFNTSFRSQDPDVGSRKEAVMNSIRSELALANVQDLINTATDRCFAKCIKPAAGALSSSDESCLARCLDRYMEAFTVVSRTYTTRINKESGQMRNGLD